MNDLEVIRARYTIPPSLAQSYFFQKYGLQNSSVLKSAGSPTVTVALGSKGKGKSTEKNEGKGTTKGEEETRKHGKEKDTSTQENEKTGLGTRKRTVLGKGWYLEESTQWKNPQKPHQKATCKWTGRR